MNRLKYVERLKKKLKLHMHVQFLKNNEISVLEGASNSADLNPVDNLLTIIKNKVASDQEC